MKTIKKNLGYIALAIAILLIFTDSIFIGLIIATFAAGFIFAPEDGSWFDGGGEGGSGGE